MAAQVDESDPLECAGHARHMPTSRCARSAAGEQVRERRAAVGRERRAASLSGLTDYSGPPPGCERSTPERRPRRGLHRGVAALADWHEIRESVGSPIDAREHMVCVEVFGATADDAVCAARDLFTDAPPAGLLLAYGVDQTRGVRVRSAVDRPWPVGAAAQLVALVGASGPSCMSRPALPGAT